jgi:hypothetical protein
MFVVMTASPLIWKSAERRARLRCLLTLRFSKLKSINGRSTAGFSILPVFVSHVNADASGLGKGELDAAE